MGEYCENLNYHRQDAVAAEAASGLKIYKRYSLTASVV
jgi:hypothetical protein